MVKYSGGGYEPDKDAGWGLIFRLNALWERADRRAESADYNGWEIVLDRIFSNLLYRNQMEIIFDGEKIIDVKPTDEDIASWQIIKQKIRLAKKEKTDYIKNKKNIQQCNENIYLAIMTYDWWLRKFMQKHQLYLKEIESNPSKALFGGAFKNSRNRG